MLSTLEIILFSLLIVCFIIQLIFYWGVLAKPYFYMQAVEQDRITLPSIQPPVSIIICIRNTYYDLLKFLPPILEQDYPEFEVIIVNDGSSDENEEALIRLKNQYSNLYSTHIPKDTRNVSRKKLGLTLGIKAAKYETLLFTEPDSQLHANNWISLMARHFTNKKSIVLGFSSLKKEKNFSSRFRAYDYFFTNLQIMSLALLKHPYAGSGRNMAYSKSHFNEQKGYVKHRILQQGEDDLFINEIATKENTAVELSAQSVVYADINNYYDWRHLKIDKEITQQFYKSGPVALWRLESVVRIGFILSFFACVLSGFPFQSLSDYPLPCIALFCFITRLFSLLFVINITATNLKLEKFYFTIPFFDLFQPFVNAYFYIYRIFKGKENYTYQYEKR